MNFSHFIRPADVDGVKGRVGGEQLREEHAAIGCPKALDTLDGYAVINGHGGDLPIWNIISVDEVDDIAGLDPVAGHGIALRNQGEVTRHIPFDGRVFRSITRLIDRFAAGCAAQDRDAAGRNGKHFRKWKTRGFILI